MAKEPHNRMRFCIRREIEFANSRERLQKVKGIPIEIALPPQLEDYLQESHLLVQVSKQIKEYEIPVRSVHAPHGRLADKGFRNWAHGVIGFAESIRAEMVVFHPEEEAEHTSKDLHAEVILNIKHVQERTKVLVAIETFWDEKCVLMPDEIMEHRLPMVLDTSRIPKTEITWIIESYRTHLVNVHLSAVMPGGQRSDAGRQFRPVEADSFCMDLLDRLFELEWNGVVTLEYMPWLTAKSMEDRNLLERIYPVQKSTHPS